MKRFTAFVLIKLLILLTGVLPFLPFRAAGQEAVSNSLSNVQLQARPELASPSQISITARELESESSAALLKIREFAFIRQKAEKLGLRVYLFGGTAASFAHYVKWDLLRKKGDQRFQPDRFDYEYLSVFRSTQDLDIVVDGNVEEVLELQRAVLKKFKHVQGSKHQWDFRPLRESMGEPGEAHYRMAILNDFDFMNQHTDSQSTGLIEVTVPKNGEALIRDARDWASTEPNFLKDVLEGKIHFYFSENHSLTGRYKQGINPAIFAVVRILTKAFQYELDISGDDLKKISAIIEKFDPVREPLNPRAKAWLEKNGKKILQHAVNLEYAINWLDRLGFRQKLRPLGDVNQKDSLSWLLNKEALPSFEVGRGTGQTALELGIHVVAHETLNMFAYDSITRAHTGEPNVFKSREGVAGERAIFGEGFYTKIGREGAKGTGLTIRFKLAPNARLGSDFLIVKRKYIVVLNKACLSVVPESLSISPIKYFRLLQENQTFGFSDLGLMEKFRRKTLMRKLTSREHKVIFKIVEEAHKLNVYSKNAGLRGAVPNSSVIEEWLLLGAQDRYPDFFRQLLESRIYDSFIAEHLGKFKQMPSEFWKLEKILSLFENTYEAFTDARYVGIGLAKTKKEVIQILVAPNDLEKTPQENQSKVWRPRRHEGLYRRELMAEFIAKNIIEISRFDHGSTSDIGPLKVRAGNFQTAVGVTLSYLKLVRLEHFEVILEAAQNDLQRKEILDILKLARRNYNLAGSRYLFDDVRYRSILRKYRPKKILPSPAAGAFVQCRKVYAPSN